MNDVMPTARKRLDLRLEELSHIAKKSLGQNFLISDHVITKIIQATQSVHPKSIIEIGPGLGAITDYLRKLNGVDYQAIEMDHKIFEYWKNLNVNIEQGDALKSDWSTYTADTLVSNLPYQISSSIVIDRSLNPYHLKHMILMFQKEVAQRIRAKCKTSEYGLLSVIAQEFWTIETVCEAGPGDFYPAPKIASRVLKFKLKDSEITDRTRYLKFVKLCFAQRRRQLKAGLGAPHLEKLTLWYQSQNLPLTTRAEELNPEQFKSLYFQLHS